jgi:tetratricopeptide (TPR) repeat protein
MKYSNICFVIMPFGEKDVLDDTGTSRKVNFDPIYEKVFDPAVRATKLPEGGNLEPRRTDKDFFTSVITQDMFEYLEYSRFALTDITGLNPNVFYELGIRHRARPAGTVIFRQLAAKIPFDINQIKAVPYEYEPESQAAQSRELITRVLTESLTENKIDSPVRLALAAQHAVGAPVESEIKNAENAIRVGDRPNAIVAFRRAADANPGNGPLCVRLGLLLKDSGNWTEALGQFQKAVAAAPAYGAAWREKGIAENKLYQKAGRPEGMSNGIAALEKAISLSPDDYDAHASLGGALKREGRLKEALTQYEDATKVSRGHSYPLLNAIKLDAQLKGRLDIDDKQRFLMKRAAQSLRAQVASEPPYDPPWSFFDLAEIELYQGNSSQFLDLAMRGSERAEGWQIKTFRDSLKMLLDAGIAVAGMREGIDMLSERVAFLD